MQEPDFAGAGSPEAWQVGQPGHAELVKLRMRMIAVENLLLAVLASADDQMRERVRRRAAEILPREEAGDHPLTEGAATEMIRLMERASRLS